jgi:hypothetical protein
MRYPDGRVVWATVKVIGRQVAYHIGDRGKVKLETFVIRIRNPANPKIPIRGDGRWKSEPTRMHWSIDISGFRVQKFYLLTS